MTIEDTLKMQVDMMPHSLVMRSVPEFLLQYGRKYEKDKNTYKGKRGPKHKCFYSSAILAMASDNFTYVEGYVEVVGIPIHHAWVISAEGIVIDPTLRPPLVHIGEYFGVLFKTEYVWNRAIKTQYWDSVIEYNLELLKRTDTIPEGVFGASLLPLLSRVQE